MPKPKALRVQGGEYFFRRRRLERHQARLTGARLVAEALLQAGGAEIVALPPILERLGGLAQQLCPGQAFALRS